MSALARTVRSGLVFLVLVVGLACGGDPGAATVGGDPSGEADAGQDLPDGPGAVDLPVEVAAEVVHDTEAGDLADLQDVGDPADLANPADADAEVPGVPDPGDEEVADEVAPERFDVPSDLGLEGDVALESAPESPDGIPDDAGFEAEATAPLKGFQEACLANGECDSGLCVADAGQPVCSQACFDSCPSGWKCRQLAGPSGPAMFCVPDAWALCRPCTADDDCTPPWGPVGRCAIYSDLARFCGQDCDSDGQCPDGYSCRQMPTAGGASAKQCVVPQGECACSPGSIQQGLTTRCQVSNPHGTCVGRRTCLADGLGPCDAGVPGPEVCNGKDDNCDGQTDEGLVDCCVCGNGRCEPACQEDVVSCPYDCKVCGDGICSPSESPKDCQVDCCKTPGGSSGCGDGFCMGYDCGEDSATCPIDCGTACGNGTCDKGENPVSCPVDCRTHACGDGVCQPEDGGPAGCPQDCGTVCGNCICDKGESWQTCPVDCGFCGDGVCSSCPALKETPQTCPKDCCVPDCVGKECGPDGCGGLCGLGLCPNDQIPCTDDVCVNGQCQHRLEADFCLLQQAGQANCYLKGAASLANACFVCDPAKNPLGWSLAADGTSCGTNKACKDGKCGCANAACGAKCCAVGQECFGQQCCTPQCADKICGDDGCGGQCGQCGADRHCADNQCVCDGPACGAACCGAAEACVAGKCVCGAPSVTCGKACCGSELVCGPDGCLAGLRVDGALGSDAADCGDSWASACRTLHFALAKVPAGGSLFVAQGTYPDAGTTATDSALLTLPDGVSVYGGFCGTETALSQRRSGQCETVLDAQRLVPAAYHVVVAASGSRLDGLTLKGGNANGSADSDGKGGGIYASGVTGFTVANCRVTGNAAAASGAGIFAKKSVISVVGSAFDANTSMAIFADGGSAVVSSCEFLAPGYGVLAAANYAVVTATDLTVDDGAGPAWIGSFNVAGGATMTVINAMVTTWAQRAFRVEEYCTLVLADSNLQFDSIGVDLNHSTVTITGCRFHGGGTAVSDNNGGSNQFLTVRDTVFENLSGSAINVTPTQATIDRCIFRNIQGSQGAVYLVGKSGWNMSTGIVVSNSLFVSNVVSPDWGAVLMVGGNVGSARVVNCTFAGNQTGAASAAVTFQVGGTLDAVMLNSVVWANSPVGMSQCQGEGCRNPRVYNSDIQGYDPEAPCPWAVCSGLWAGDPQFVDPASGDFHPRDDSSLVDNGVGSVGALWAPLGDLEQNPRPCRVGYDVGAYELCP